MTRPTERARRATAIAAAALLVSAVATASDYASETVAGVDPGDASDAAGTRAVIDLQGVAESADSLGHVLESAPSTDVRRAGALGAPAYASVRGAEPYHVRVVLDGIPLNGARNTAFDLSTLPPELIGRATLHRSTTPVQLGAPLPGGVLELQTRFGRDGARAYVGGGSFGSRRAGYAHQVRSDRGDLLVSTAYSGANNDFRFFDDGGTPLNPNDDGTSVRRNAHVDSGGVLVRHRVRTGGWRLTTLGLGSADVQGVPGLGTDQALRTELRRGRLFAALRAERSRWPSDAVSTELVGGASLEWQRYLDRGDELGLGAQDVRERGHMVLLGVRPIVRPSGAVGEHLELRAVLDWTHEGYAPDDESTGVATASARRDTLAVGVEVEVDAWDERLRAIVGGRADAAWSSYRDGTQADVLGAPQAGVCFEPWQDRSWSAEAFANAGIAERLPGFFELYGDSGATVGNPDLRPEVRRGYDAGVRFSGDTGAVDGALTYVFFDRYVDDLIVFVQNGLGVATAWNIAEAAFRGHEVAFTGGWQEYLRVNVNYALIDAVDRSDGFDGERLPGRATHSWSAAVDLGWRWLGARYGVDGNGEFTLDRAGQRPMPARTEHDASLFVRPDVRWRPVLALTMHNIADARTERVALPDGGTTVRVDRAISDFVGQPLPGRAFYATLTLHPERRRSTENR